MARTSKKTAHKDSLERNAPLKIYSAGIYARLSVEGDERKNESVDNQIEIAKGYIREHPEIILYECYTDLGKTGTNFQRDGFERMMQDVRRKKIDCILVKDLSRFGRNHIETGNYVEKIFPFLGVRFIAVADCFDSIKESDENETLGVNLKNIVNELYAKDIAIKVKSSKKARWEQGSYTGGIPPYGYRAEWNCGKRCLFIEEATADIVRKVYDMALSGKNRKEIAVWLYQKQIHRPRDYHATGHVYRQEGELLQEWTTGTVKLLLTNPVYMGCLVQARTRGMDYRLRNKHDTDPEDWSIKEHTHEAVIREELFFQMAEQFEKASMYCNKEGFSKKVPLEKDAFRNVLYCGECGARLRRISSSKELSKGRRVRHYGYCCPSSGRIDELKCGKKYISLSTLSKLVKTALGQEFGLSAVRQKDLVERNKREAEFTIKEIQFRISKLQSKLDNIRRRTSEEYQSYRMGELSREAFQIKKEAADLKAADLQRQLIKSTQALKQTETGREEKNHFLRSLLQFNEKSSLTGEVIDTLISRIEVYPDKRVKIIYAFTRREGSQNGKDQDCFV